MNGKQTILLFVVCYIFVSLLTYPMISEIGLLAYIPGCAFVTILFCFAPLRFFIFLGEYIYRKLRVQHARKQ